MKKIAILQSNYIPWKGYFDLINSVDEFIVYDDVQYTKNDWRNRNLLKTPKGVEWLTIPVSVKKLDQKIIDTKVASAKWGIKHWKSIVNNYSKSKYFHNYKDIFEELYLHNSFVSLSEINVAFIVAINSILEIKTPLRLSSEFDNNPDRNMRLINICTSCGANKYLSGPSAANYLDVDLFNKHKVTVEWMSYGSYSEYTQLYPPFAHNVSVLDLIFNEGKCAKDLIFEKNND